MFFSYKKYGKAVQVCHFHSRSISQYWLADCPRKQSLLTQSTPPPHSPSNSIVSRNLNWGKKRNCGNGIANSGLKERNEYSGSG